MPIDTPYNRMVTDKYNALIRDKVDHEMDTLQTVLPAPAGFDVNGYNPKVMGSGVGVYHKGDGERAVGSGISATLCGHGNARGGFLRMAKSILSKLGRKAPEPVEEEGSGYARGGQAGFDLSRTYRIAEQWQNFPYFVPPNNPVVHMVNPRGRVHIPTEGNGKAQGGFLPLLAAKVVGKKLLKKVGKKVATKVAKKAVKKVAENVVENAVENNNEVNEGGFLPMLAARVIGKKLLQNTAKKASQNAVLGEGKKKAKKAGKPKYDVI